MNMQKKRKNNLKVPAVNLKAVKADLWALAAVVY